MVASSARHHTGDYTTLDNRIGIYPLSSFYRYLLPKFGTEEDSTDRMLTLNASLPIGVIPVCACVCVYVSGGGGLGGVVPL